MMRDLPATVSAPVALTTWTPWLTPIAKIRKGISIE